MTGSRYDLIVIGSGAAGEKGAAQAAYFGKRVLMVEREQKLGGATAGTTVPSKTLRETAVALSGLRARKLHGVDLSLRRQATVRDLLHHEETVKRTERERVERNMERHHVEVVQGNASFESSNAVKIVLANGDVRVAEAEVILIATGSAPRWPEFVPASERIFNSDTILQIPVMPKRLMVLGGGVIGCEYACLFAALGVDVLLIHNGTALLSFLDADISAGITHAIRKNGVKTLMPEQIVSIADEGKDLKLNLESGKEVRADAAMVAMGRSSNTADLNLAAAGIKTAKYGKLAVDENYQVIDPETQNKISGVYAAGDVIGAPALASTSMEQARYAMIKAFNLAPYKKHVAPILPVGIYTIPECSAAGLTEQECVERNIPYVVGRADYQQNARGMIIGDEDGFLKLIYEYNDDIQCPMKLLGAHVMGESASELIHLGVNALLMNATNDLFIDTCFNYPTLGELYKYATYVAMGVRAKRASKDFTEA